ncbi:MAG: aminotransferase class I/II-fold pyridoxal phosphate-dependent enzyme [Kordiimonadaceae bacterium]|jgi:histidinol-phosphate aminotransferase|nr:aminotransferase class I/II-fold pyridoxal phosphate-dependent enzyme [Kordiimonadaceae bacterium]MBT6033127.1 aminotransferase class I/II-fold pyridoxal phosphate-dependent enzyme [Kordiimonadaceae bacterium]
MTLNLNRREWLTGAAATGALLSGASASAQTFMTPNVNPTAENPIRAHFNENVYGQSKIARKAMIDAFDHSHEYAFSAFFELRNIMAELEDIAPEYVGMGAGSTEFLEKAAVFNKVDGGALLTPLPTYGDILRFSKSLNTKIIGVPVGEDMAIDLNAMRAAYTDEVKLIYLCNPNNPCPTIIEKKALREFCIEMSEKATILIDEAYYEYVDNPDFESMISLVKENKNIIVTRTASKIHAFAGIRIGVCFAHPDLIKRMFGLFSNTLNYTAMKGAIASYQDFEYQTFLKQKNQQCLKIVNKMCDDLNLEYVKSNANFTFFNAGRPSKEVQETMKKHHILTGREFKPFTNWVRLSMTKPEEIQHFSNIYRKEFG